MDLTKLTGIQLSKKIKAGEVTVKEAVDASFAAIEVQEPAIHAFLTIDKEKAYQRAGEVQRQIDSGRCTGPLAGVPMAVKDNICTKGMQTTCASRMLYNFIPPYNADVVERLEAAGAIVIGKTNMDEFAMGSTTESSAFQVTRNPVNPEYVPGGSSGGSCAAVASSEILCALGSDTGGSIRQPSAFCGVTGLKPTYGMVSRYGLIAYASSMDQIGPVAKDVADCTALLEVIAGHDCRDSTSLSLKDYEFMSSLQEDVKGLRIGIPREYFRQGLEAEIKNSIEKAAEVLKSLGARVEYFNLGLEEYTVYAYYILACAEASSNLARFDGVKYGYRSRDYEGLHDMYKRSRTEGFGPEVRRRILLGSFALSSGYYDAYYLKALRVKALIQEKFERAFASCDLLLAPVTASTAPRLGESLQDPVKMYLSDIYTVAVNLAGLPAISVPCGRDHAGLPIGMQMIGDRFQERVLLRAAYAYEKNKGNEGEEK